MQQSNLDGLLALIPIDDIAVRFDSDEVTANRAVKQTLGSLLGGMIVNLNHMAGANAQQSFDAAVAQHAPADGRIALELIDLEDGQKIVEHVLAKRQRKVAAMLGKQADNAAVAEWIAQLLPILAPIVMAFLARSRADSAEAGKPSSLKGVLGDVFGELTGSMARSRGSLGSLLGGLFTARR